jgi:hypothetical protein
MSDCPERDEEELPPPEPPIDTESLESYGGTDDNYPVEDGVAGVGNTEQMHPEEFQQAAGDNYPVEDGVAGIGNTEQMHPEEFQKAQEDDDEHE